MSQQTEQKQALKNTLDQEHADHLTEEELSTITGGSMDQAKQGAKTGAVAGGWVGAVVGTVLGAKYGPRALGVEGISTVTRDARLIGAPLGTVGGTTLGAGVGAGAGGSIGATLPHLHH